MQALAKVVQCSPVKRVKCVYSRVLMIWHRRYENYRSSQHLKIHANWFIHHKLWGSINEHKSVDNGGCCNWAKTLNLFSVNIHGHKRKYAIFWEAVFHDSSVNVNVRCEFPHPKPHVSLLVLILIVCCLFNETTITKSRSNLQLQLGSAFILVTY